MKEFANDTRSQVVVKENTIVYRGQVFPLGTVKRGTFVPLDGPNILQAMRLRLAEIEMET